MADSCPDWAFFAFQPDLFNPAVETNIPGHLQANVGTVYLCDDNDITAGLTLPQDWPLDSLPTLDYSFFDHTFSNYDELQQHASLAAPGSAPDLHIGASSSQAAPYPITTGSAIEMGAPVYENVAQPATLPLFDWGLESNGHASERDFVDTEATDTTDQANGTEVYVSSGGSPTVQSAAGQHQPSLSAPEELSKRYQCATCGTKFANWRSRWNHSNATKHHMYGCQVLDCTFTAQGMNRVIAHLREAHAEFTVCNQCQQPFSGIATLGYHATVTRHASFLCPEEDCAKTFSRFDVLTRHQDKHRSDVQRFPCPHCRRHRGADGFKRKDHLTQHLRNYHHIGVESGEDYKSCPHEDCPDWRSRDALFKDPAFRKGSDYIAHMRKVHKESEFPCTESGCNRVGPKGYFRLRDLLKHKLKEHNIPIE